MPSSATKSSTAPCQSRIARVARRSKSSEDRDRSTSALSIKARPAALARQEASARSAAAAASSRNKDSRPDSTATFRFPAPASSPFAQAPGRTLQCRRTRASERAPHRVAAFRRQSALPPYEPLRSRSGRPRRGAVRSPQAAHQSSEQVLGPSPPGRQLPRQGSGAPPWSGWLDQQPELQASLGLAESR